MCWEHKAQLKCRRNTLPKLPTLLPYQEPYVPLVAEFSCTTLTSSATSISTTVSGSNSSVIPSACPKRRHCNHCVLLIEREHIWLGDLSWLMPSFLENVGTAQREKWRIFHYTPEFWLEDDERCLGVGRWVLIIDPGCPINYSVYYMWLEIISQYIISQPV